MHNTFDIRHKRYHCIGRVAAIKTPENLKRLLKHKCEPDTLVRSHFVIVGKGGSAKKIEKARDRGIRVLTQDEALEALDGGGTVTLASSSIGQIIGELRSLFARTELSDSQRWLQCADVLDRCDPNMLPDVIEYVESAFVRTVEHRQHWHPDNMLHRLMGHVSPKWLLGNPDDELFVAPPGWLDEMVDGRYSPKHGLVRAINLDHHRHTLIELRTLLENPYLSGVHFLNFGRHSTDPGELLRELDQFTGLELRTIWLYSFNALLPQRLGMNAHALKNVHTLAFHGCFMRYNDEAHYGSLDEEHGLFTIGEIKALSAFDRPPRVNFVPIGRR